MVVSSSALLPRLPGLLLHLWWWSQATGSYHTGGWLGLVCLKIHIIASARCWKSVGKRRDSNPNLIKQRQFPPNLHIQLVFCAGNKRSFFFAFFWAWNIWCCNQEGRYQGWAVWGWQVSCKHRWFHQTRIPSKKTPCFRWLPGIQRLG